MSRRFLLTLSICLLIFEIRTRLDNGAIFSTETVQTRTYRLTKNKCASNFDQKIGWKSDPSKSGLENIFGTKVHVYPPGVRRNSSIEDKKDFWLASGDSYTFGDEVSDKETWPELLEEMTGDTVLNAGGCGYDLAQSYLRAEELISQLPPKKWILSLTEFGIKRTSYKNFESVFEMYKPYFKIENGTLQLKQVPVPFVQAGALPESFVHRILGHSFFADKLLRKALPNYWLKPSQPRYSAESTKDDDIEVSCLLLDKYKQLAEQNHISLLVIGQYGYFSDPKAEGRIDKVLSCAKNKSIGTIDLKTPLVDLWFNNRKEYESLYIGEFSHMTPKGNKYIADKIYDYFSTKNISGERPG